MTSLGRDSKGRFLSGKNHPMKTEELRKKSSESHKGQVVWNRGKIGLQKHSQTTKEKMSISHIGKNVGKKNGMYGKIPWNKGVPHSEEQKTKLKIARRNRVIPKKDTKPERMMQLALSLHKIQFDTHKAIIGQPDIFIEPNICIFVDGDFWHGNPEKYDADTYIIHGRYAKDIWAKDLMIQHKLNKDGYQVIRIWESDIKSDANSCAENIIRLIQSIKGVVLK